MLELAAVGLLSYWFGKHASNASGVPIALGPQGPNVPLAAAPPAAAEIEWERACPTDGHMTPDHRFATRAAFGRASADDLEKLSDEIATHYPIAARSLLKRAALLRRNFIAQAAQAQGQMQAQSAKVNGVGAVPKAAESAPVVKEESTV